MSVQKSSRVLQMSFEVASFDVDVFLHCGNSWKLEFGFLYVWWQAWLKFASSPGEAVIRFQMFACLWLKDFFVSFALILSHLKENV